MRSQARSGRLTAWLCLWLVLSLVAACSKTPMLGAGLSGQMVAIRIIVTSPETGAVAGASVVLKKDSQPLGPARTTDGAGVAEFPDVPVGDGYRAFVNAGGFQSGVSDTIKVMGGAEVPVTIAALHRTGTGMLVGSVKETRGAPIAGAQVVFGGRAARTNGAGQFTFANIPPGRSPLTVSKAGFSAANKPDVEVRAGDVTEVETLFLRAMGGSAASVSGGGQYLLATPGRVAEMDRNWQSPWRFAGVSLVSGATRLPSGEVAIADAAARKVVVVDRAGTVLFTYGGLFSKLRSPSWVAADKASGSLLVTDTDGDQLIELTGKQVTWGNTGHWRAPRAATYTGRGTILVADTGNRAVAEVDRGGNVIWSFSGQPVSRPVYAQRLPNGNTLITDAGFNRVLEVDIKGKYVWHYDGVSPSPGTQSVAAAKFATRARVRRFEAPAGGGDVPNFVPPPGTVSEPSHPDPADPGAGEPPVPAGLMNPRMATRLLNGNTLIADTGNGRVLEVSPTGDIVWQIEGQGRPAVIEKLMEGMPY